MDGSAGRRACRRHRDAFKVPWKFESWMMQTGDSILTSCSVLASSSDLASLSPYLPPPRVSFSPSSCLVPSRAGHRESGAMLKSSVIPTLPALHRTQYKTEILPPGAVRFPRYPRLCVYCIRRLKLELHAPKVGPSSLLCSSSGGGGSKAPGNLKFSVRPRPRGRCGRCQPGGGGQRTVFFSAPFGQLLFEPRSLGSRTSSHVMLMKRKNGKECWRIPQ